VRYTLDAALVAERLTAAAASAAIVEPAPPVFDRPVFIVAAPRSGSTLLFETLAASPDLWTVGDESHKQFESIPALRPNKENQSNRLGAGHATPEVLDQLKRNFLADLIDSEGRPFAVVPAEHGLKSLRLLEKTPKNALRIPFLLAAFPDARFIFLYRDARQNISSLLDSWRSRRYVTYPRLPGWPSKQPWSHLLVPGWQQFIRRPLAEVVAYQWVVTNQAIMKDLAGLPGDRWCTIEYDALLGNTPGELERLCDFADIAFASRLRDIVARPLQPSKYTLTPPRPDKWRKNAAELEAVLPVTTALMETLRAL
jgi:Sulfotransferase family